MLTDRDRRELTELEHTLWREETRWDRSYMQQILTANFFEFGRSGRTYKREDMFDGSRGEIRATLKNLNVHEIADGVALVTYVSEVQYDELEIGNRSSLWTRGASGWQLRFHQGTLVPKDLTQ